MAALRASFEERLERQRYLLSLPLPASTDCPKARDDEAIVAQDVLDEFVVYDLLRHKVHELNPTAALVFGWCDGQTEPAVMVQRLAAKLAITKAQAGPLVWLAMDRLEKAKLLVTRTTRPAAYRTFSRRRTLRLVAAAVLPVVYSVVAPSVASAASAFCSTTMTTTAACDGCGSGCGGPTKPPVSIRVYTVNTDCTGAFIDDPAYSCLNCSGGTSPLPWTGMGLGLKRSSAVVSSRS